MAERKVRVRFAPSPTGALHIGGVRTALYNYLFARQHDGDLIFRIEDTDSHRFVPGAEEYILESFKWLGIHFDEGVSFGGEHGPYRQSERREIYKKYVEVLLENGKAYIAFDTPEELDAALVSANADLHSSTAKLKPIETAIREKKDLQKQVLAYAKAKPVRDGLKAQKTEKARSAYRERHESDFIIADAATRYFRAHGVSKLPSHKALQAEIEQLTAEKNAHYNEYREKKARVKELHTVKSNLSQILQGEKDREKKHKHER